MASKKRQVTAAMAPPEMATSFQSVGATGSVRESRAATA
jgi:hypothetical protein